MTSYRVTARRIDSHGSLAIAKQAEVVLDTDLAGRQDAMNPVELLLSALAGLHAERHRTGDAYAEIRDLGRRSLA